MTLFTVGPVEMDKNILELSSQQVPYFRTPEFSNITIDLDRLLKKTIGTVSDSKLAILTSSGTGAMEAAVINVFDHTDKLLIVNGGGFGARFAEICAVHNIPFEELNLPYGETLSQGHLEQFQNKYFTGLLVNIHETSTGQLYSIQLLSNFCKKNNLILVVDAISSYLADPFEMDKYSIDVTILSSNKGLAVAPGLSFVIVNQKTHTRMEGVANKSFYFNLSKYFVDVERGQTPYTPAVSTILQAHKRLEYIDKISLENYLNEIRDRAVFFRDKLDLDRYSIPEYPLSNIMTPVICPKDNAEKIYETLKEKYQIMVNPIGGELQHKLLRIGHVGSITYEEIDRLLSILNKI
ncbi:aspartate aminotransferase [Amphibacillus marinus]|uniref:Aspartate aminotransferase n=1 Tax=Amphibacillus marinus TaxID=872970 RepID=A0A1H8QZX8_9BACI|nr:aminotransferase class V-fold PLP-dependent enzyme [Amphibacillus marinus]SEO59424.1 aspartate aminotransferase [Amphibacillus marinus]